MKLNVHLNVNQIINEIQELKNVKRKVVDDEVVVDDEDDEVQLLTLVNELYLTIPH
jgi:hypothetical protein